MRTLHFLQCMAQHGITCTAIDLRGQGVSTGRHGYVRVWDDYLDDLSTMLDAPSPQIDSNLPRFVLGHSHGGLIVAAAVIQNRLQARGTILSSPFFQLKWKVSLFQRSFAVFGSWFLPALKVKSGIGGTALTRDPQMASSGRPDPLCPGIATPRWFMTVRQTQERVRAQAAEFKQNLLMLVAGDDTVADPAAATEFFQSAGSKDKTLRVYEGYRHELLRELGREAIFEEIRQWIAARVNDPALAVDR